MEIVVDGGLLEKAVRGSFDIISKTYAEDTINKSPDREILRDSYAILLGHYGVVREALRKTDAVGNTGFYESQNALDSRACSMAAHEALCFLEKNSITKKKEITNLFDSDFCIKNFEKDPDKRSRLVISELIDSYVRNSRGLGENLITDYTFCYYEWLSKWEKDFVMAAGGKKAVEKSSLKSPVEANIFLAKNLPDITFSDVGGLEHHKAMIYDAIKLHIDKKEEFLEKGIEASKGLIFYGPKGCSKTFIAKAVANEMKLPFFYLSGPELRKKYVGEGAELIRQLFNDARALAPSIIFIDEVDACLIDRNTHEGGYVREQVNQILAEIDGFHPLGLVKVIVASNYYEALDGTFLDRFPPKYHLEFRLPDQKMRLKVLKAIIKKQKVNGVDLEAIAGRTEKANCRALKFICNEAGVYSIKEGTPEIEQKHFEMALADYLEDPRRYSR